MGGDRERVGGQEAQEKGGRGGCKSDKVKDRRRDVEQEVRKNGGGEQQDGEGFSSDVGEGKGDREKGAGEAGGIWSRDKWMGEKEGERWRDELHVEEIGEAT